MAEENAAADQPAQPQFAILRTYVKDLSFESPMGVKVFSKTFQPKIQLDVNTKASKVVDTQFEVTLMLTITAKLEEETAFIIEIQQAGLFNVTGFPEEQMKHVLGAVCPNFLFPYAREAVDNLSVRGGFPPLQLAPIDFDGLFRQQQAQAQGQAAGENPTLN